MDDQVAVGELEVEEFNQVAGGVGSDAQPLGRVVVRIDVVEAKGVVPCMGDLVVGESVAIGRPEDSNHPSV